MASDGIAKPGKLATLCARCSEIFRGKITRATRHTTLWTPETLHSIQPKSCCVCSIIRSEHQGNVRIHDSIPNLEYISYYWSRPAADELKGIHLYIYLEYADLPPKSLWLAVIPADGQEPPYCDDARYKLIFYAKMWRIKHLQMRWQHPLALRTHLGL